MRIVPVAENHPNVCIVTRDPEGPYVDFEISTQDMEPHVYLSVATVAAAARLLDLVPVSELEAIQRELKILEDELERIQNILDAGVLLEKAGV